MRICGLSGCSALRRAMACAYVSRSSDSPTSHLPLPIRTVSTVAGAARSKSGRGGGKTYVQRRLTADDLVEAGYNVSQLHCPTSALLPVFPLHETVTPRAPVRLDADARGRKQAKRPGVPLMRPPVIHSICLPACTSRHPAGILTGILRPELRAQTCRPG